MSECTRQTFGHTDGLRPRRAHSLITTSAVPARQPEGIILVFLLFLTTCTLTETLLTCQMVRREEVGSGSLGSKKACGALLCCGMWQ